MISRNEKGFTLVEILVVIVIIGILLAVLIPRIDFTSNKARETGVKSDFRTFQTSAEAYLKENVGKTPTESGLNSFVDGSVKFSSGTSKLLDPWKQPYKMQIKNISPTESMIVFRSTGLDTSSKNSTDYFHYESLSTDKDDLAMLIHYKDGFVKGCTIGFSDDSGTMKITGAGVSLPAVTYDVPQNMRQTFQSQYSYEYAIDAHSGWGPTARTYVYSNTPLNLSIKESTWYDITYSYISESNNRPYAGFHVWWESSDDWGYYPEFNNPPTSFASGEINGLHWDNDYDVGGRITKITDVSGASATPFTILGCN